MIPDCQSIMLPLLQLLAGGRPRRIRDGMELLADFFKLSPEGHPRHQPSGRAAELFRGVVPCTVQESEERFERYVGEPTTGKDVSAVRIVLD